jgi:hypothetical protein
MEGKLEFGDNTEIGPPASNGEKQLARQELRRIIGKDQKVKGCWLTSWFSSSLAFKIRPSATTTVAPSKLSIVKPCRPVKYP